MSHPHDHLSDDELQRYAEGGADSHAQLTAHIETCQQCRTRAEGFVRQERRLNALKTAEPRSVGADCPGLNDWWELVRGLASPEDSTTRLAHAARCGHCSRILRQTLEDIRAETVIDDSSIQNLDSSQPSAMRVQARRLAQAGLTRERPSSRAWLGWLIAAAVVVAAVTGTLFLRRSATDRVDSLLAQAYVEHRPSELRFPGAGYGPIRQERGGTPIQSQSLMEAEIAIPRELSSHPIDVHWLQISARTQLLQWRFNEAIATLNKAKTVAPSDPSVLADLAAAYFERGQANDDSGDYRRALDLFSAAIEMRPKASELRFNRAVILGHLGLNTRAAEEWKEFLRLEPGGPWAEEARARLAELPAKER